MKKIIITGALGHIGSKVVRELPNVYPGAEIVMIDNLLTQRYCSLFNLPSTGNYRFIEADVLKTDLNPIIDGANVVLHFSAITDAASSFNNRELVEHVNYNATVHNPTPTSNARNAPRELVRINPASISATIWYPASTNHAVKFLSS